MDLLHDNTQYVNKKMTTFVQPQEKKTKTKNIGRNANLHSSKDK